MVHTFFSDQFASETFGRGGRTQSCLNSNKEASGVRGPWLGLEGAFFRRIPVGFVGNSQPPARIRRKPPARIRRKTQGLQSRATNPNQPVGNSELGCVGNLPAQLGVQEQTSSCPRCWGDCVHMLRVHLYRHYNASIIAVHGQLHPRRMISTMHKGTMSCLALPWWLPRGTGPHLDDNVKHMPHTHRLGIYRCTNICIIPCLALPVGQLPDTQLHKPSVKSFLCAGRVHTYEYTILCLALPGSPCAIAVSCRKGNDYKCDLPRWASGAWTTINKFMMYWSAPPG